MGVMSMPSNTSFEGGKPATAKPALTVHLEPGYVLHRQRRRLPRRRAGVPQDNALLKCRDLAVTLDRVVSFKEGQKENQSAQVEKLLCDHQVWVLDEKKDPSGKRIGFDRLVATQLTADNQDGPITLAGPVANSSTLAQGSTDVFDAPANVPEMTAPRSVQALMKS